MQLYEKKCEGPMEAGIKQGLISGVGFGLSFALLFCVYASSFYAGAQLVGHGKTTFSKVFQVSTCLPKVEMRLSHVFQFHLYLVSCEVNVSNVAGFLCIDHGSNRNIAIKLLCS